MTQNITFWEYEGGAVFRYAGSDRLLAVDGLAL
jgi:hypothetical protein